VLSSHKNAATPVTVTLDRFAISAGDPTMQPQLRDALYRLDVAGSGIYTDTLGQVWQPDSGLFSPATAVNEGATTQPLEIANTDDDSLYQTYRGNVGNVALSQRVLTYNLPMGKVKQVDLRLHFAERFSGNNAVGKRLFDIEVEGVVLRKNFDIFAAAGGINTAVVLPLSDIAVHDGSLTIVLRAVADYPAIAAIEVLCEDACPPPDTTAPEAPTFLTAVTQGASVALDWSDNNESDLGGYNVYRAGSATGPFTKLNSGLISASSYSDASAPANSQVFYQVTAVDLDGNESTPSNQASAITAAGNPIRINAGGSQQTVNGVVWSLCSTTANCKINNVGVVTGGGPYSESGDTNTNLPPNTNNAIFTSEWTGGQSSGIPVGQTAFTFDVPVSNGNYTVRLYFAELNKNGAGLRLFDVVLEGTTVLANYDVFVAAGGINKAKVEEFTTTVNDGKVTIAFVTRKENAKISAIEIIPAGPAVTPTPSNTATATNTAVPTNTPDPNATATNTAVPSNTATNTATPSNTVTPSNTSTPTTPPVQGATVARINVGGPAITTASGAWSADQFVTGGIVATDSSGLDIANTLDDELYRKQRETSVGFSYAIPVPSAGEYRVRLHFAEIVQHNAGIRRMTVNLEGGAAELENFNIAAAAGDVRIAIVQEFVVNVSDGVLNLQITPTADRARLAGIEVFAATAAEPTNTPTTTSTADPNATATSTPSPTNTAVPTNTPTATNTAVPSSGGSIVARINAGGPAITTASGPWSADQFVTGGIVATDSSGLDIANTLDDELYRKQRETSVGFSYAIPVPSAGKYRVRLHFAEIVQHNAGIRRMTVNLEGGAAELENFNIAAAAGGVRIAIVQEFVVNVSDGVLNLQITPTADRARLAGIEVLTIE
jgi:hypothetical protein